MPIKVRVLLDDQSYVETEVDGATPIGQVMSWARDETRTAVTDVAVISADRAECLVAPVRQPKRAWSRPIVRLVAA